jgi:hypothetical protein
MRSPVGVHLTRRRGVAIRLSDLWVWCICRVRCTAGRPYFRCTCAEKKSKSGIATPRLEIDLVRDRLRRMKEGSR